MKVYYCDVCGADMRTCNEHDIGVVNLYKRNTILYDDKDPKDVFFDVCPVCYEKIINYIKGGAK